MSVVRKKPQQKCVSPRIISRTYGSCRSNVTSSCILCVQLKYGRWSWPPSFHWNRSRGSEAENTQKTARPR